VSPHPNPVTRRGLGLIETALARHREALKAALAAEDREGAGRAARELRYWMARQASARLTEPAIDEETAGFGTAVTLRRADGRTLTYHIVGEDEAEPEAGRIAWVSPVAQALREAVAGDAVMLPGGMVEVVAVDPTPEPG
jgi:transcription elongation GreA/GreB family factor